MSSSPPIAAEPANAQEGSLSPEEPSAEGAPNDRDGAPSRFRARLRAAAAVLARHVLAGLAAAVAIALLESLTPASGETQIALTTRVGAFFALLGFMAPLGLLLGIGTACLAALFAPVRWLGPFRIGLSALWSGQPDPRRFAGVFAFLIGVVTLVGGTRMAVEFFRDNFHAERLIRWAIAIAAPVVLFAALVAAAATQSVMTVVGRLWGRAASPLAAVSLVLVSAVVVLISRLDTIRRGLQGVVITPYLVPLAAALLFGLAFAWAGRLRRPGRPALIAVSSALVTLFIAAASYGSARGLRQFVEGQTASGQRLLRFYSRSFDRDNDGHAALFGGDDCDDGDPHVHPGALDVPGDGVDADCFGGDGAPVPPGFIGDGAYVPTPESTEEKSIVILMVDALRPDHLGTMGYGRPTSPRIDRFAESAVVFENAYATSSRSVRSIPSMFTGLYPGQIAYGPQYLYPAVLSSNELLAEVANEAGYITEACMGTDYFSRVGEFFQGFDEVTQGSASDRGAPTRCALSALSRFEDEDKPFFLWVHLFNVHVPYLPDGRSSRFDDLPMGQYDTEITLADQEIGRIMTRVPEDAIVVLVSDHGEAFEEHGNRGHSTTLYEEEVRSVLMVRAPGFASRRVPANVTLADLSPTLRNLTGMAGRPPIVGQSLVPFMAGEMQAGRASRPLVMELLPDGMFPYDQKAILRGSDKLIWWVRDGTTRFADLQRDPEESADGWDGAPQRASELFDQLRAWNAFARSANETATPDAHLLDALPPMGRHLGYEYSGFTVEGYDPPEWEVARGDTIRMTFYYRVTGDIDEDLMFFVSLRDQHGEFHDFHAHHYPVNGTFRTPEWRSGQLIRDAVEIVVPENVRTGEWTLSFSVYDSANWNRQSFRLDGQSMSLTVLGEIDVQ